VLSLNEFSEKMEAAISDKCGRRIRDREGGSGTSLVILELVIFLDNFGIVLGWPNCVVKKKVVSMEEYNTTTSRN
jgi:hypothetical protein